MLLFAWFAFTAHLGLAASTWMDSQALELRALVTSNAGFLAFTSTEFKLRNPSSKLRNPSRRRLHPTSTLASWHPSPRNPSIKVWSHQSSMPVRRIHLNGIQASNFGHINPPRQSVASTSKKSKLRISATSTLHPRPIGGVRCARRAITFVLYTFVANNGREWEHARAPICCKWDVIAKWERARASESGGGRQVRARALARQVRAGAVAKWGRGLARD